MAEESEAELSTLRRREQEIRAEILKLEDRYCDQGAGFARKDLFNFIAQHRCRHSPRQLARAIAGLPDMSCRDSFELCGRFPSKKDPHKNYEVFLVFARAWAGRDRGSLNAEKRIQLFREQIERIPKTRLYNNERVPNYIRKFFEDEETEVYRAINSCLTSTSEPERIPYLITSRLLNDIDDRIRSEMGKTDFGASSSSTPERQQVKEKTAGSVPNLRLQRFSYRFAEQVLNSKLSLKEEIEQVLLDTTADVRSLSRPRFNQVLEERFVIARLD